MKMHFDSTDDEAFHLDVNLNKVPCISLAPEGKQALVAQQHFETCAKQDGDEDDFDEEEGEDRELEERELEKQELAGEYRMRIPPPRQH